MTQGVAFRGRLPGVRSDPSLPRVVDDSIRLDVAGFVGFAERGPVDDPQVIEDPAQYATVFGSDLQLAIDDRGVPIHAALPDAVRSFFDNGGRRAHVVRVAGREAVTVDIPVRVTSRIPLGGSRAIVAIGAAPVDETHPLRLVAASPGGWAAHVSVDIDVIDTVLALTTDDDGIDLAPSSRRLLDAGDTLLVERLDLASSPPAMEWIQLRVPVEPLPVAPPGGWRSSDVARLIRADLTVRVADGDVARSVERFRDLRLGAGSGRSRSWADVVQPPDGRFVRDASMYVRAVSGSDLVPIIGPVDLPIPAVPVPVVAPEGSRAALQADGLDVFDPVRLFLDDSLTGHTVEGLRSALEVLGLDDAPRARGVHSLALVPDVAIVAVPDLYHRPWNEQAVLREPDPTDRPPVPATEHVGFQRCAMPRPPEPPSPPPADVAPAVERMVLESVSAFDPTGFHVVATAVADLCAARADMIAVLGLPRHAGVPDAQDLLDSLSARPSAVTDVASHVGVWHPWGKVVETRSPSLAPLRPVPPDGAVAGSIASTELERGIWIEPAGRSLAGVLAIDTLRAGSDLDLFDRGLNVLRRRAGGFATTSAHSVSSDRSLLQLSVRRVLISVRKLALREGARFVFEPDDDRFRVQVATTFRRFLERLRLGGALHAYEVDIEPLSDRSLRDEGTVRIDLKLAPTSPIEFLTVSLLRSGDGLLTVGGA